MKDYIFDLENKKEILVSPSRKVEAKIDIIINFDDNIGIERNWIKLDKHNSIKKIKRILSYNKSIMLTSFLTSEKSSLKNYLIYIDFGKYLKNGNQIEFIDLELDIIIKKNKKFKIDDMDELIDSYEKELISKADFYTILNEETKLLNLFEDTSPISAISKEIGEEPIKWLLYLG